MLLGILECYPVLTGLERSHACIALWTVWHISPRSCVISATAWWWEGRVQGRGPRCTHWPSEQLAMSELEQTVGELKKVLEGGDPNPYPKSVLCLSILRNFLILVYGVSVPFSDCGYPGKQYLSRAVGLAGPHIHKLRNSRSGSARKPGPSVPTTDKGFKYLCTKVRKNIPVNVISLSWVILFIWCF